MIAPIRGKVAYVLDNGDIVINVGTDDGVHRGMPFDVIDEHGLNIRDPDTKKVIGSLEVLKIKVEVIDTQKKISIAAPHGSQSARKRARGSYRVLSPVGPFARSLMPPEWVKRYETLKETEETLSGLDEEEDSYVNIGDLVVQVIEEANTKGEVLTENTKALKPSVREL